MSTASIPLRQLSGLPATPARLSESALILVDAQNTYLTGVMQLSAVEPALDAMGLSQGQAVGFQRALERFARDCARRASCPYPGRPAAVIAGINRLLASLDVRPMRTSAGRPLTQPLAERLSGFLVNMLEGFGEGLVTAVPGLLSVGVILFITKAANDVAGNVFENVYQGRSLIPGVHRDTAHATRRLLGVLIWAVGIAIAYPYLPVADSEAFKGLSVMFGFMLTLGSAGIVTQLMSGLVLIYSRALNVGDFVSIGEVTGVVKEMSALSTKVINMRNEEVTIPNAVLVSNPIKNFTGAAGERGALVSTTVTIGYDTPWRQVHAMLINAAERTPGLRGQPKPFVMQKALQDFYVEYELYAYVDRPLERIQILSELHSQIQDQFNAYGVQIMSPHFVLQPRSNVVVNKDDWFAAPAEPPAAEKS